MISKYTRTVCSQGVIQSGVPACSYQTLWGHQPKALVLEIEAATCGDRADIWARQLGKYNRFVEMVIGSYFRAA